MTQYLIIKKRKEAKIDERCLQTFMSIEMLLPRR